MMKTLKLFLAFSLMVAVATSCGDNKSEKTETTETTSTLEEPTEVPTEAAVLEIHGTDEMKFDKSVFTVKAGQEVQLTLKHVGTMSKDAMGHNWVLLQQGTDVASFGAEAAGAKDADYIPASQSDKVIAHTKLLGGGESDTITFTAPTEKGSYTFICSFPGHFGMMKGEFIVE